MTELSVCELIPHRPPLVFVDRILKLEQDMGIGQTLMGCDHYAVIDGRVPVSVQIEAMAQTAAAVMGAQREADSAPAIGMLVGISKACFDSRVAVDVPVQWHVRLTDRFDAFVFAECSVQQGGKTLAEADLKFYIQPEDA